MRSAPPPTWRGPRRKVWVRRCSTPACAAAGDALAQRLQALGLAVRKTDQVAATPAGRDLALVRFVVDARADPAAVDRLALWVEANARSAILEQLTANAGADGKSDVRLELDALVRQRKAAAP